MEPDLVAAAGLRADLAGAAVAAHPVDDAVPHAVPVLGDGGEVRAGLVLIAGRVAVDAVLAAAGLLVLELELVAVDALAQPGDLDAEPADLERIASTFSVSEAARGWLARVPDAERMRRVVRIERVANIAAGAVPWDPFDGSVVVEPGATPTLEPGPVLVIGKDLERGADSRATIDAVLRLAGPA